MGETSSAAAASATINGDMVVGRYAGVGDLLRQDVAKLLAGVWRFYDRVGKKKTSKAGLDTTCREIESYFPATLDDSRAIGKQLELLNELVAGCAFDDERDRAHDRPLARLRKRLADVVDYAMHFAAKLERSGVNKRGETPVEAAAHAAMRKREKILAIIDKARRDNTRFGKVLKAYLRSAEFERMARDPHSAVAVRPNEIMGTKAQRRALLAEIDAEALEQERRERVELRQLVADDVTDAGLPRAVRISYAPDAGEECAVVGDDDEDEDEEPEFDDDVRSEELEAGAESESEGETSDECDASETSEGGVLFEANLERNNAELLEQASATTVVRGGRALRERKYRVVNLDEYGRMADEFKVDDVYDGVLDDDSAGEAAEVTTPPARKRKQRERAPAAACDDAAFARELKRRASALEAERQPSESCDGSELSDELADEE